MFLQKKLIKKLKKKLKKLLMIYNMFLYNHCNKNLTFEDNYTYCFYPTTPARQIHFTVFNIQTNKVKSYSSGYLLKPHFWQYHSMKKNFTNLQKLIFLLWLALEDINKEPFYFYIKAFNFLTYEIIKQIYIIFNVTDVAYIISKPYNYKTKSRKRIKRKTWKMLLEKIN